MKFLFEFERFVAWRYLRERGSRAGLWTMLAGCAFFIVAAALTYLERGLAQLHPFELTERQLILKQVYQWGSIAGIALGVLVLVFGFFHRLQSIFTTISTYGVFLGTAALVIVLSVMNGFEADLRHKIIGSNAHILVTAKHDEPFTEYRDVERALDGLCAGKVCVVGHTPYLTSEVVIAASSNYGTVIIKGIDPRTVGDVTDLAKNLGAGSLDALWPEDASGKPIIGTTPGSDPAPVAPPADEDQEPPDFSTGAPPEPLAPPHARPLRPDARVVALDGLLAGKELARNLHLYESEEVQVVSPIGKDTPAGQMPRLRSFRIAGVFFTGMYEYDAKFVYVTIPALQHFLSLGDEVTGIEIKISDVDRTGPVVQALADKLGDRYLVQDWKELNKSLFSALKLEQIAMFLVLTIIILVASFSIISNLIMVVVEKGREIATLKSLGASDWMIMRVFVAEGIFIGLLGTLLGIAVGIGTCLALKYFGLPLDSDVYYIDRLPVAMSPLAIGFVALAGLTISVLATVYPAYVGATLRPIDGLRR
jgi:lipoprotein-releasing system permease protein